MSLGRNGFRSPRHAGSLTEPQDGTLVPMNEDTERRLRDAGARNRHRSELAGAPEGAGVIYQPYPGAPTEAGVIVRATDQGVFVRYSPNGDARLTPYERLELAAR